MNAMVLLTTLLASCMLLLGPVVSHDKKSHYMSVWLSCCTEYNGTMGYIVGMMWCLCQWYHMKRSHVTCQTRNTHDIIDVEKNNMVANICALKPHRHCNNNYVYLRMKIKVIIDVKEQISLNFHRVLWRSPGIWILVQMSWYCSWYNKSPGMLKDHIYLFWPLWQNHLRFHGPILCHVPLCLMIF